MLRKTLFQIGEFYHIYNRGTDKRNIFTCQNDYNRFVMLLYLCNSIKSVSIRQELRKGRSFAELLQIDRDEQLVDIVAYCLMPNHFHLLVREKAEGGISIFMKKISTAYSMYFNSKNDRSGALFEGRFKAKHINNDEYLRYLISYIHLNPVKLIESKWKEEKIKDVNKASKYLKEYRYSSYQDYLGFNRAESKILELGLFFDYFETFETFIGEWLTSQGEYSLE